MIIHDAGKFGFLKEPDGIITRAIEGNGDK